MGPIDSKGEKVAPYPRIPALISDRMFKRVKNTMKKKAKYKANSTI
jgi:hypothetical protein